jgi:phage terminase large subunit
MSATDVSFAYVPREAFVAFHNRRQRFAQLVVHRRAGKTCAIINDLLIGALEEERHRPQLAYIGPTYTQAKRVAWEYLKDYAQPFLAEPPNESELRVRLKNNGRIFLAGSDNPDSLRGLYLDGAAADEFATCNPSVWTQILLPSLADRQGFGIVSSTPHGKNHFYSLWQQTARLDEWYRMFLTVEQSQILPVEEVDRLRREMPPDEFEQEMMCSFTATSKGAILFREIEQAEHEGRIADTDFYDSKREVYVASDIGFRDTAAFWFAQRAAHGFDIIGYVEDAGLDADDWAQRLRTQPYPVDELWLPHDARARSFTTRNTALETFLKAGFKVRIVPRTSVLDRINAARSFARGCRFNRIRCAEGLNALREWSFEWNPENKEYSRTPRHNWASHGGDGFSYLAQMMGNAGGLKPEPPAPQPRVPIYNVSLDDLWEDRENGRIRYS